MRRRGATREAAIDGHAALWVRGVGFVFAGALFWMVYFDHEDRLRPEPRRMLLWAFVVGALASFAAAGAYRLADSLGAPAFPGPSPASVAAYCFGLVGPIEEGAKWLLAALLVLRSRHFDEPIDGLVYAASVAIGFASVENLLYLPHLDWPEQLARAIAAPLTHALFAALWGFGWGRSVFAARTAVAAWTWRLGSLALAATAHGLYDFVLLRWNAPVAAAAIALVLWIAVLARVRRLAREG